ncbi:hypothetical protein E4T66_14945 [Sinimarinibacterium sp. CAU 1509]|uniref:hypothetical protein n=1 Tax=Sinimarinibacterium sp. CAU 1509 TaxID=2562283 RepID=UPI0010AD913E|nr:hypothetical protein [Sinimarinibacterium sp. CAU 1509]TJY58892.1 hypothetical protein E4T66_14945 [Sinimarinibacterium sp. CAU 1509]
MLTSARTQQANQFAASGARSLVVSSHTLRASGKENGSAPFFSDQDWSLDTLAESLRPAGVMPPAGRTSTHL